MPRKLNGTINSTFVALLGTAALIALYVTPLLYNYCSNKTQKPRYRKKFNDKGEYLPFYGYTSLALLEERVQPLCKAIENFIKSSSLKNYFSALPACTYHMTIFNIYSISRDPIPPVQRWMNETNQKLPDLGWLPGDVLKSQHAQASAELEKVSKRSHIVATEQWGKRILGVRLTLDEKSDSELKAARRSLAEIYEHPDTPLQGEGDRVDWHMTFGYRYKDLPPKSSKEWAELAHDIDAVMTMASGFLKYSLVEHNVYFYNSMTNFIPFRVFYP